MRTRKYLGAAARCLLLGLPVAAYLLLRASLRIWTARSPSRASRLPCASPAMRAAWPTLERPIAWISPTPPVSCTRRTGSSRWICRAPRAGELAELFGAVAVAQDRQTRLFRFRAVAREVIAQASGTERA